MRKTAIRIGLVVIALAGLPGHLLASTTSTLASIDLSGPLATRSPWRFTASQGPDIADAIGMEDHVPGIISLCLSADGGRTCQPWPGHLLTPAKGPDLFSEPHVLEDARIVRPDADRALLLLRVASLHGGNGDQRVATTVLAYDRARDSFVIAYEKQTRRNNNQDIRDIAQGPLKAAIISAEPTDDAPFAFWITVSKLGAGDTYKQILRYRSATRYGDGNALAVIDSEMPNIERRLGLWHPGSGLPLPRGGCPKPRLINDELWC